MGGDKKLGKAGVGPSVSVRLTDRLHELIARDAINDDRSIAWIVRNRLEAFYAQELHEPTP